MKTQRSHSPLNRDGMRRDTRSPVRAEIHIDAFRRVTNSSAGAARALATSLEVNRETGWRDNKLCRRTRDICSCLHFIGGYPATSNKRTNGLIRNNNDAAGCGQWGR
jgi:hypothetical protein